MTAVTQPIDRAFVEIVPDFDDFARAVQRGVDQAMRELRTQVQRGAEQVERDFARAGDGIGRDFQQAGETAERALGELSSSAAVDAERIGQTYSANAQIAENSISELRRSALRDFDRISHQATVTSAQVSGKFSAAFASALPLLAGVGVAATAGLGALSFFGLKATAQLEQTQISFNSLLGSAEKGTRVFKDLQQFAAVTPFTFPDVAGAAQRFFAFNDAIGLTDDTVRQFLTTIGNVASVTGGGAQALNSVTLAMGQIASSGKVTLENLNQISEALPGFSGVAAIAAATGKSTAEVMREISAGELDAATGIQALLKGMDKFPGAAGAMEKQSQTLLGVFSTFQDTISQALVAGFEPVIPQIKASLLEVTPILQDAIGDIAPVLGKTLALLLPLIGKLVQALVPVLEPIIDALGPALEKIDLVALGEALGELTVSLVPLIPLMAEFLNVLIQLAIPVILATAAALRPVGPLLNFFADAIGEVGRALEMVDWAEVGASIIVFFAGIGDAIKAFFEAVKRFLFGVPEQTGQAFGQFEDTVQASIKNVMGFITGIPARIQAAIGNLGNLLVDQGRNLVRGLWDGIQAMGGWLRSRIIGFAKSAIPDPLERFFGIGSPSKLMADQIGEPLAAGIGVGFDRGLGSVAAMLAQATQAAAGGIGGGTANTAGTSAMFGPGSIRIVINGTVTEEQAARIGVAAGNGMIGALNRRGITTAVRQI